MLATSTLLLTSLLMQDPQVDVSIQQLPSTLRLGDTVQATLRVEGSEEPGPPQIPEVDGLTIRAGRPSSSVLIINGARSSSINFPLVIQPRRVGRFVLPPIAVEVGGRVYRSAERRIEVVKEVTGANFGSVVVQPSRTRVYVHEPIRFDVECAVDRELDLISGITGNGTRYLLVALQADWLSAMEGAEPIEEPEVEPGDQVNIVLNNTPQPANFKAVRGRDGKLYHLFRYRKSILPTRPGKRTLEAPALKFTVALGRQDQFSVFSTRRNRDFIVYGEPIGIEVLPLPEEGRPDPYFGAVGRFAFRATADKVHVKVGGSVKLTITISGSGNFEYLKVPELGPVEGFHPLGSKTNRTRDQVSVTYDLTPTSADVKQLPSIAWNFFDTTEGVETYVEVATDPIPIDVQPLSGAESLRALPGAAPAAVEPGVDDIYDVKPGTGLDPLVLPPRRPTWTAVLVVLCPWLLCLLGAWLTRARRRARADVAGRRARGARRAFRAALDAGSTPHDAFVAYLADRLGCEPAAVIGPDLAARLQGHGVEPALGARAQVLVEQGVAARYGGVGGVERAECEALVRELEGVAFRAGAVGAAVLVAVLWGGPVSAQDLQQEASLDPATAAYRAGDYETAAARFRAAAARDRRAEYNLGNCMFRLGRYAEALAAYERARLAMPRDADLLANVRLCRERLGLASAEGEAFGETVARLRDSFTAGELFWLCVLTNALAAGLVCFGGRRLRIAGIAVAAGAAVLLVEVAFLGPNRPPRAVVIRPKAELRAEPKADLPARQKIRAGVAVEVLGPGREWTLVRSEGVKGFVESASIEVIQ